MSFLMSFKTKEETLFHKKVEPVTKTSTEKNNSRVSKEEIQISSPSMQESEKVWGLIYLLSINIDTHCQQMPILLSIMLQQALRVIFLLLTHSFSSFSSWKMVG